MAKLADADPDALREALASTTEAKPAKRLMVALAYLDGESVATLSTRYGIPRSTVYYWLDRFESEPLESAIRDEDRPGRPPKLDERQREQLRSDLQAPPSEQAFDAEAWTPALVREHVDRRFDVSYSEGHARRLLDRLGPS
ncbi:transposase [Halobium salinum]|uniref:Transposase n=1 Tax=Halobium salinum TaxID=1364940 RepID=A0ABD5P827_9EURY|nr:helix-turn-helix domain-containing protein [Halobium salinum]